MLVFVFSGLIVILDQFFKRWIVRTLEIGEQGMELIPGVIGLTHTYNTGAAFGLFAGHRWPLVAISFVACIILVCILLRYNEGFWGTLGLAAVLGGAVGNLIDRVIFGSVVDMFQTLFVQFAIFNIADIFITLGFITFCIHFIIVSFRQAREEKEALAEGIEDGHYDDDYDEQYDEHYEDDYDEQFGTPHDGHADQYSQSNASHEHENPFYDEFSDPSIPPAPIDAEPNLDEIAQYMPEVQDQTMHIDSSYIAPIVPPQESNSLEQTAPNAWHEYYEPASAPETEATTLEALNSLETELSNGDDYDVDALLREYGFDASGKNDK